MGKTETLIFETFHGIPRTFVRGIHAKHAGGRQGGLSFDLLPIPAAVCTSTVELWGTGLPETHEARESLLSAALPFVPRGSCIQLWCKFWPVFLEGGFRTWFLLSTTAFPADLDPWFSLKLAILPMY